MPPSHSPVLLYYSISSPFGHRFATAFLSPRFNYVVGLFANRFVTNVRLFDPTYTGLDHLLYTGSEEEWNTEEAEELRVACFMSLVSFLSGRIEVLRVAPRTSTHLLNAVARALVQSATITATPLTAAGLDGTGEVIQVRYKRAAIRVACTIS